MRKTILIVFLMLILICLAGCESPLFQALFQEQEWSENYALADGVTCTAMEMIDGDVNTVGKAVFPERVHGMTVYGAFPSAEAEVVLPEKKSIHKIVIRSENLSTFDILASVGKAGQSDNWKIIKEFKNNREKEIVIKTSVMTDKIKIRARPLSTASGGQLNLRDGWLRTTRPVDAPEIQEIELYGFK